MILEKDDLLNRFSLISHPRSPKKTTFRPFSPRIQSGVWPYL